jgi:hypothetical protein
VAGTLLSGAYMLVERADNKSLNKHFFLKSARQSDEPYSKK